MNLSSRSLKTIAWKLTQTLFHGVHKLCRQSILALREKDYVRCRQDIISYVAYRNIYSYNVTSISVLIIFQPPLDIVYGEGIVFLGLPAICCRPCTPIPHDALFLYLLYSTYCRLLRVLYTPCTTHGDLLVPRTRTVTYGPRSFAVSGPTVWNTLPSTLRVSTTTFGQFQSGVKTTLFRLAYGTWLGAFVTV